MNYSGELPKSVNFIWTFVLEWIQRCWSDKSCPRMNPFFRHRPRTFCPSPSYWRPTRQEAQNCFVDWKQMNVWLTIFFLLIYLLISNNLSIVLRAGFWAGRMWPPRMWRLITSRGASSVVVVPTFATLAPCRYCRESDTNIILRYWFFFVSFLLNSFCRVLFDMCYRADTKWKGNGSPCNNRTRRHRESRRPLSSFLLPEQAKSWKQHPREIGDRLNGPLDLSGIWIKWTNQWMNEWMDGFKQMNAKRNYAIFTRDKVAERRYCRSRDYRAAKCKGRAEGGSECWRPFVPKLRQCWATDRGLDPWRPTRCDCGQRGRKRPPPSIVRTSPRSCWGWIRKCRPRRTASRTCWTPSFQWLNQPLRSSERNCRLTNATWRGRYQQMCSAIESSFASPGKSPERLW